MSSQPTAKCARRTTRPHRRRGPRLGRHFLGNAGDWPRSIPGPFPSHAARPGSTCRQRLRRACGVALWWIASAFLRPPPGSIQPVRSEFLTTRSWPGRNLRAETGLWPSILRRDPGSRRDDVARLWTSHTKGARGPARRHFVNPFSDRQTPVLHHTPLTEEQILIWADAHHRRTGRWPYAYSGPVPEPPEWNLVGNLHGAHPRTPQSSRGFVDQSTSDQPPRAGAVPTCRHSRFLKSSTGPTPTMRDGQLA